MDLLSGPGFEPGRFGVASAEPLRTRSVCSPQGEAAMPPNHPGPPAIHGKGPARGPFPCDVLSVSGLNPERSAWRQRLHSADPSGDQNRVFCEARPPGDALNAVAVDRPYLALFCAVPAPTYRSSGMLHSELQGGCCVQPEQRADVLLNSHQRPQQERTHHVGTREPLRNA